MKTFEKELLISSPVAAPEENNRRGRAWRVPAALACLALLLLGRTAQAQIIIRNPVTIACPAPIEINCSGAEGAVATFEVNASSTAGRITSVTAAPPSGSTFPVGETTVRCTAVDSLRNSATCSFTVTVRKDTTAPVLKIPEAIMAPCTSPEGAVVNFESSATDACDGAVDVVCTPPSGSTFPIGTTTVTCIAVDKSGNLARGFIDVTVTGECPRECVTIECPPDLTVECSGNAGTKVEFVLKALSRCSTAPAMVTSTPTSGSLFSLGTTVVNVTASDDRQNQATCSFKVTVADRTAPVLQLPAPITPACTSPHGANVSFIVAASDACDPNPVVTCTPPSGSQFPLGKTTVTCTAVDANGNQSTASFDVTVTGDCAADCLTIECPENITVPMGRGGITPVEYPEVIGLNTCTGEGLKVTCNPPSGSIFPLGTTTVECLTSDGVSRKTCQFKVTVVDRVRPVFRPLSSIIKECSGLYTPQMPGGGFGAPMGGAFVNYTIQAIDNSGTAPTVICDPASGSFFAIGTNHVDCTATDASGNTTTAGFDVVIVPGMACEIVANPGGGIAPEPPDNWGFELGLVSWKSEGDAFANQSVEGDRMPVKRVKDLTAQMESTLGGDYWREVAYPVGHQGHYWIGTAEDPSALPGGLFDGADTESLTGTLLSKSFKIEKPYITFLIGGTDDINNLRVELWVRTPSLQPGGEFIEGFPYKRAALSTGHNREVMRLEQWGVIPHVGDRARIRIVDNSTTGHLNVDDFRFESEHFLGKKIRVGAQEYPSWVEFENKYYRWDSPVWGFADMHTHPMSYLGFGEAVLRGRPDGNIADALENCRCFHAIPDFPDLGCGDFMRGLVMHVMEDGAPNTHGNAYSTDAYAQFNAWPVFWTITHQQMWHEWVQRAYNGGLRVMVALCVNNPMLAVGAKGIKDKNDDKYVSDAQIDALIAFVDRHSDFMEIALDPFQLRDIVRRNKLAVIIGSELDDIGNFARYGLVHQWAPGDPFTAPTGQDKTKVSQEIQRLYNKGLRYIFPVHLMNNSYAGTAIGNDMLNVANKFLNHEGFEVEPGVSEDHINFYLSTLDFTEEAAAVTAAAVAGPAVIAAALPILDAVLTGFGAPPGVGIAVGAGILPLAILGTTALPIVGIEISNDGIPFEVLPLFNHYPTYKTHADAGWQFGHKNRKGLTPLGEFAVMEMMKRGMMIDIDHMSQKTIEGVLDLATNNPVGYPLNSGHNSPRELGLDRSENGRTLEQFRLISQLGGLYGVGWENSESKAFADHAPSHKYTESSVPNDCAGTTKTFAQNYLYGMEAMRGRGIALGTDIDGLIPAPGPRFGPMSAFALGEDPDHERITQVYEQHNGVRYTPEFNRPITTAVFTGRAVDSGKDATYPRTELGYAYNKEQGDVFAAICIYNWAKPMVQNGPKDPSAGEAAIKPTLEKIVNAGAYFNRGRVLLLALGMLRGIHDWPVTSDALDGNVEALQKLGKALYESKVAGKGSLPQYVNTSDLVDRFKRAKNVWNDYNRIFGENTPLKRCETGFKQWDINFEGVAHYGLVPDFLQDLSNVGLSHNDLSALFKSAEDFARMWTKTLNAADAINHPELHVPIRPGGGILQLEWLAEEGDQIEETDNLLDPSSWRPVVADVRLINRRANAVVNIDPRTKPKFYRVRKQ